MISGYFVWWYSRGIQQAYGAALALLGYITDSFSLPTLFKTLFQPWKNDVLSVRNASLADQLKVWQLNLASRIIGFVVRLIVIGVAVLMLLMLTMLIGGAMVIWVFVPILVVALPLLGVGRLFS